MSDGQALTDEDLASLDASVERVLAAGEEESLPVLGYGEISLVLGWPADEPRFACKRMPAFASRARFEAYRRALDDYVAMLGEAGVTVVETQMRGVGHDDGSVAGYVVQPVLAAKTLAPAILHRSDPTAGHPLVAAIADAAAGAVSPRLGLDAQLSNWAWEDGRLTYIDVSTPMLWDEDGRSRLDLDPLAQAYPAVLRAPLRRLVAPKILDGYRDLRGVFLDLTGNLLKERLGDMAAALPREREPAPRPAADRPRGGRLLPLRRPPLGDAVAAAPTRPRLATPDRPLLPVPAPRPDRALSPQACRPGQDAGSPSPSIPWLRAHSAAWVRSVTPISV